MADNTAIEWTDATWNPITGCSVVSPGCTNCYAMTLAGGRLKNVASRKGLTKAGKAGPVWTGEVRFNEAELLKPLRWKRPRKIFVCAHGDLFHENVPDDWIDRVFAVMALTPQHTYQVLTKRSARMRAYLSDPATERRIIHQAFRIDCERGAWLSADLEIAGIPLLPLENVWLGVSAEDQARADERRADLKSLADGGWLTWVSYEPALGPVDWTGWEFIRWMVCGFESGPKARPGHPDWARKARDWSFRNPIAFLFKQWGSYRPTAWSDDGQTADVAPARVVAIAINGDIQRRQPFGLPYSGGPAPRWATMSRMNKKAAGRLLDGVLHDAYPERR